MNKYKPLFKEAISKEQQRVEKAFKQIKPVKLWKIIYDQELGDDVVLPDEDLEQSKWEVFDLVFNPLFKNMQDADALEMTKNYRIL